jgi:protein-disulfide isomerase
MTAPILRRLAAGLALLACTLAVGCSKPSVATGSTGASIGDDGYSMGNAKAAVTVVEYASASCSHCARWDAEVFPDFKKKYIDTGKVHYVYREFLTSPEPYAAGAFLLARCAGPDKYFGVVEAAYRGQKEMFANQDMRGPLLKAAQSAGMNEQQFTACTSDQKAILALNDRVQKAINVAKVTGTPTFEVNGTRLLGADGGEVSMDKLSAAIDPLLAKK